MIMKMLEWGIFGSLRLLVGKTNGSANALVTSDGFVPFNGRSLEDKAQRDAERHAFFASYRISHRVTYVPFDADARCRLIHRLLRLKRVRSFAARDINPAINAVERVLERRQWWRETGGAMGRYWK